MYRRGNYGILSNANCSNYANCVGGNFVFDACPSGAEPDYVLGHDFATAQIAGRKFYFQQLLRSTARNKLQVRGKFVLF